jgi:hypothetical protein
MVQPASKRLVTEAAATSTFETLTGSASKYATNQTGIATNATLAGRALSRQPVPGTTRAAPAFQTGNGISDGVTQGGTAVTRHLVVASGGAVRLVFTNHYPTSAGGATESDGTDTITVRASIEPVSGGTRIPVSVNGAREFTIPPGGSVTTDPLGIDVKRGTYIWSWVWVSVPAAGKFPRGSFALSSGVSEGHNYTASGTPGTDVTLTGTRPTTVNEYVYCPASILVRPVSTDRAVVGIVGDSIAAGTGDNQRGWVEASLDARYSFQKAAYPSEQMSKWTDNNGATRYRRLGFLAHVGVTHIFAFHGRNDMDLTYGTLRTNAVAYWTTLSRFAPTWACTIMPYTTSTDSWATVANQTLYGTSEGNRVNYNTWLRDGAPIDGSGVPQSPGATGGSIVRAGAAGHPLAGVIELADLAESARDSGKWKAGYTSDGLHPNTTGANGIRDGGGRTLLGTILGAQAT